MLIYGLLTKSIIYHILTDSSFIYSILFPIVPFANMRKTSLSHEDRGSMEAIQDGTYCNATRRILHSLYLSLYLSLTHSL